MSDMQWTKEEKVTLYNTLDELYMDFMPKPKCGEEVTDTSYLVIAVRETETSVASSLVALHSLSDMDAMEQARDAMSGDEEKDTETLVRALTCQSEAASIIQAVGNMVSNKELLKKAVDHFEKMKQAAELLDILKKAS